ncbi:MAG TPA: MarR family transcriptional regulator [Thermoanaerobaculia bacterium]|nr:MarR family transcriptional regulator [Thermoanaerobaculia bacterium]
MALTYLSPLHRATRQIGLWFEERLTDFAGVEGHLLSYLAPYGPCPVSELNRVFGLKPSTMTSILDRLEAQGLLERTPNPEDGRSFLIGLTKKGEKASARVNALVTELEKAIGSRVTKADLAGFQNVMNAIEKATAVEVVRRK